MTKYIIKTTTTFQYELKQIYNYIHFKLKEPNTAKNFYRNIKKQINSLQYLPQRHQKIPMLLYNTKIIHQFPIGKYIVLYEINKKEKIVNILHLFHSSQNFLNKL